MKQYTTPNQTAKLIELGFDKPKGWNAKNISSRFVMAADVDGDNKFNYSIGELIEMLPRVIEGEYRNSLLAIESDNTKWWVMYLYMGKQEYASKSAELIDALFEMIIKLKEEGVI